MSAVAACPALKAIADGVALPPANVTRKLALALDMFGTPERLETITGPLAGCAYTE